MIFKKLRGKKNQVESDSRLPLANFATEFDIEKLLPLPPYLLNPAKEELRKILISDFPFSKDSNKVYGFLTDRNNFYQGDCLQEIPFFYIDDNSEVEVIYNNAILLSNTCSVSVENQRTIDSDVNFGVVLSLTDFINYLISMKVHQQKIDNFIVDVKDNKINNILFLPSFKGDGYDFPESIVRFDRITTIPMVMLTNYSKEYYTAGDRLFSFSDYGIYLFLFKLSVFFCRFGEGIGRNK